MEIQGKLKNKILQATTLRGIDIGYISFKNMYSDGEATYCSFLLDETIFLVEEDLQDSYRSSAKELKVISKPIINSFDPVPVYCQIENEVGEDGGSVIKVYNKKTNALILEVGDTYIDDYYPSYICNFSAEAIGKVKQV